MKKNKSRGMTPLNMKIYRAATVTMTASTGEGMSKSAGKNRGSRNRPTQI